MTLVFYDFETTGLNPYHDKIIEYAFLSEDGDISSFVNSTRHLSEEVIRITGITLDMLRSDGISKLEAHDIIITWLKKLYEKYNSPLYLIAHNNDGFDKIFFKRLFRNDADFINKHVVFLDTLYLAKFLMPKMKSLSMKTLTKVFKIESGNHRALGDTKALKKVYTELIKKIPLAKRSVESIYNMLTIM